MKSPKIAVFTRCHYDGKISNINLFCFKNYFLETLKAQTYKEFDIVIISNDNIANEKLLMDVIKESGIQNKIIFTKKNNRLRYEHDIEVNLDSDDGFDKDVIQRCVDAYYNHPKETFLIVFDKYIKVEIFTKRRYSCPQPTKKNKGFPTNFYAVVQKGEKKTGCGATSHNRMDEVIPEVITISDVTNIFTIHVNNTSSKLNSTDKLINE